MAPLTFFWHDYETFGAVPRRDRPAQFAGVRTDADLNEIEVPVTWYCRPSPDFLPEPEACLLTGILPQTCLERGLPEHAFADAVEAQLARPGTVGVGYNSIRFDDEVTRFLFWRCLIDPYAREWQNGCGRWDLLDAMRCAYALRPEGIEWPRHDDGKPSFRLEHLARANGIDSAQAHEALADVRTTLQLARRLKSVQPKLWDFCLKLRRKEAVLEQVEQARLQGRPLLHVSGMYAAERGCLALVWPLAPHPVNRNEIIVWDLAADPAELSRLDVDSARRRLFTRSEDLPDGEQRLPVKTIHVNKSPVVIANLKTLRPEMAERWRIDVDAAQRHAETAAASARTAVGLWREVYRRDEEPRRDVDEDLYGAFVGDDDRRTLQRLRAASPERLAARHPAFSDSRLDELAWRYRARNFAQTLNADEQVRWRAHCRQRLCGDEASGLRAFGERLAVLEAQADAEGRAVLQALRDYARSIDPGCG